MWSDLLCLEASSLARRVREEHGSGSAGALAARLGVPIIEDCWQVAGGRILNLAECSLRPPEIRLNRQAIADLAVRLAARCECLPHGVPTEEDLIELAVAHELYHLLSGCASGLAVELAAHTFAREVTALPFSPEAFASLLSPHDRREEIQ